MGVKVIEQCRVSLPPGSPPPSNLPLTFLDIPWLLFPQGLPLFFYKYPHSMSYFNSITLPLVKNSLSLTLQYFSPFVGTLYVPQQSTKPEIVYFEENHVLCTVAESNHNADFEYLISDSPKDVEKFHPLISKLENVGEKQYQPLFSVQITVFPNHGICIGLAYHHVIADGRTLNNFIKTWAGLCKDSLFTVQSRPFLDRTVIKDPCGLEPIFLQDWWWIRSRQITPTHNRAVNRVLATVCVSPVHMDRIKESIIGKCNKKDLSHPVHLSPYVLACSFVWVCLVKTQELSRRNGNCNKNDQIYFGFIAGGVHRLDYSVPVTYSGNCVGFGRAGASRESLLGENGVIAAAKAMGSTIKRLDVDIFDRAENWVSDWETLLGSEQHLTVFGSPKVKAYEVDFGWGRAKKIEDISIEGITAISLSECKNVEGKGAIEIGLVLPKPQMDTFMSIFNSRLTSL